MPFKSYFTERFPDLRPGEFEEIGVPISVLNQLPDRTSVRMFATLSETNPNEGYYLQVIKDTKAGWGNGTAAILCTCLGSMFRCALVLLGFTKTPCKHAKGLREALKRGL